MKTYIGLILLVICCFVAGYTFHKTEMTSKKLRCINKLMKFETDDNATMYKFYGTNDIRVNAIDAYVKYQLSLCMNNEEFYGN